MNTNRLTSNNVKRGVKKWSYSIFRAFFLLSVAYVVVFPLIYMLSKSFIPPEEAIDKGIVWLPKSFSVINYKYAWQSMDYLRSLWTTLSVHIVSAVLEMAVCSAVAYGLARFKFRGNSLVFFGVILTIIVPTQAISVPLYLNFANLDIFGIFGALSSLTGKDLTINLVNTGWSFYLPALLGVGLKSGLFIFIFRQFFRSFPKELEEAASIDGCGPLKTFLGIVVPSSGIAYLCVFIFAIIAYWNDYYLSVMMFKSDYPLAVRLTEINTFIHALGVMSTSDAAHNVIMTGCLMFILPILVVYLFLQKKFIQSVDRIGIVG